MKNNFQVVSRHCHHLPLPFRRGEGSVPVRGGRISMRPNFLILLGAVLLVTIALPQLGAQTLNVGPNVNINRQSGYQAEEAIAIDPTNPNRIFFAGNIPGRVGFIEVLP